MSYAVHANKRTWRFATEQEARAACEDVFRKTGHVVAITESKRKPTHSYIGEM